jgi:tetratricopeptide (TPR) repeat protein
MLEQRLDTAKLSRSAGGPWGKQNRLYAEALSNLATLYVDSERYEEAEPLYRKALEIFRQVVSKGHPMLSQVSQNLGVVYHKLKRYPEAERLYRSALESREDTLGRDHPELAYIQTNLAKMYLDATGRRDEAGTLHRRALEIVLGACSPAPGRASRSRPAGRRSHDGEVISSD